MRRARIGLYVQDGRLTVVGITGRQLEHFVVADAEDPAGTLAAELDARGLSGRLRVGLDRRAAVVRAIDLPRATGGDLRDMLAYELERHVTFPADDARFDWIELPADSPETARVLVAVAERRTVERPLVLLATAKRRPAALTIACHELTSLLPRALPSERVVWAHRDGEHADLLFLDGRTLLAGRHVRAAEVQALAREIARSLGLVRWPHADSVWLSGDNGADWRADLSSALGVSVSTPPYADAQASLVAALPAHTGAALLALAVAVGSRTPTLNLLPADARPWVPSYRQLVTAGLVAVTALLGLSIALTHTVKVERYLGRLAQEIRRLEPDAKAVEALTAELARKRRVLSSLRSVEDERIRALPVLQELTETLPVGAWLQALTMDRRGVELTGQADTASTLIPLLEASPWLERVEFTSPVTKTQSKEQFRIRAAWEAR